MKGKQAIGDTPTSSYRFQYSPPHTNIWQILRLPIRRGIQWCNDAIPRCFPKWVKTETLMMQSPWPLPLQVAGDSMLDEGWVLSFLTSFGPLPFGQDDYCLLPLVGPFLAVPSRIMQHGHVISIGVRARCGLSLVCWGLSSWKMP